MINTPKYPVSAEDRELACQEEVIGPLRTIINQANSRGRDTFQTITAMEKVLRNLRIDYADPNPLRDPTSRATQETQPSNDWPAANH